MLGEYEGLGVELLSDTNNNVTIITVFDNSPAKKAGILVGDIIKEVDKKDATKMTSTEIANYIKDSKLKTFNIKVDRNGTTYSYNIKKEKIELKSVTTKIFNTNNKKVGYIYISIFANNTYTQFRDALLDMEKNNIDSLVIDVRDNAGGYLHIANEMISLFLKKDSIVYQIETKGSIAKVYDHTEDYRTYPIAVLINKQSASASEILASALKDVYHSMIIGEASYGKGTVQQTEDLGNGAMIKYTIQKWLTPNGDWIDGKGVEPTTSITLDSKYQLEPTDANDNQLQKALELLTK
jgi:carboxyl-terminal processing protease